MNVNDLGKLILQNIKVLDPYDAVFELQQLEDMTKKDFSKEIKLLSIPNVEGRPDDLEKAAELFQNDFPEYKKSKLSSDNVTRYKPVGRQ